MHKSEPKEWFHGRRECKNIMDIELNAADKYHNDLKFLDSRSRQTVLTQIKLLLKDQ